MAGKEELTYIPTEAVIGGYPVNRTFGMLPFRLGWKNNGISVHEGGIKKVRDDVVIYSHGSTACASLLIENDTGLYVLHSFGSELTPDQLKLFRDVRNGVIVGGHESDILGEYAGLLRNFVKLETTSLDVQGLLTVVGRNVECQVEGTRFPRGVYAGYARDELFTDDFSFSALS